MDGRQNFRRKNPRIFFDSPSNDCFYHQFNSGHPQISPTLKLAFRQFTISFIVQRCTTPQTIVHVRNLLLPLSYHPPPRRIHLPPPLIPLPNLFTHWNDLQRVSKSSFIWEEYLLHFHCSILSPSNFAKSSFERRVYVAYRHLSFQRCHRFKQYFHSGRRHRPCECCFPDLRTKDSTYEYTC